MIATTAAISLGLAGGARHAFEPDHLAAVSTLISGARSSRSAVMLGLLWGLGHTIALLAVGVVLVALDGMLPARQLPLESYLGYTLFKNGFPAAYGGAWVFGRRALFGINVFAQFRGGESGFILCQLLRVFRQSLGVEYIEVEPYQYGEGNSEGIRSGAFWFYYRHGFRPVDGALRRVGPDLRRTIVFGRHDVIRDAPIARVDLLVCRNTLMYFDREAQRRILARFHLSLVEAGYLFLG